MSYLSAIRNYNQNPERTYICQEEGDFFAANHRQAEEKLSIHKICSLSKDYLFRYGGSSPSSQKTPIEKVILRDLYSCHLLLKEQVLKKHNCSELYSMIKKIIECVYNFFYGGVWATHLELLSDTSQLLKSHIDFDFESKDLFLKTFERDILRSIFNENQFAKIKDSLFNKNIDSFSFHVEDSPTFKSFFIEKKLSEDAKHSEYDTSLKNSYALSFRIKYFNNGNYDVLPFEFKIRKQQSLCETDYKYYQKAKKFLKDKSHLHFEPSGILRFKSHKGVWSLFLVRSTFSVDANIALNSISKATIISLTEAVCLSVIDNALFQNSFNTRFGLFAKGACFVFNEISLTAADLKSVADQKLHETSLLSPNTVDIKFLKDLIGFFPSHKKTILDTVAKYPTTHEMLLKSYDDL